MLLTFLLLCNFILAEELTLFYTTDLSEQPELIVEHQGTTISIPLSKEASEPPFQIWKGSWTQEDSPFFQLHILHQDSDNSLSTVQFGRKNPQILNILNDSSNKRQQFLSSKGTIEQAVTIGQKWSLQKWFWLLGGILCLLLLPRLSTKSLEKPTHLLQSTWVEAGFFLLLSAFWQRSLFFIDGIPAKYHDSLGSFWLIERASSWNGFTDPLTEFPTGANYAALDSYLLWLISLLFRFVSPLLIYKSWLILAPVASALGASFWAKDWGAKAPWSWISGLGFGFSGLVVNAIFEGQIYQTLLVWLPLTGWAWWRFLSGYERRYLWLTLVFTSLALFSSSYIGASALILISGLWIGVKGWRIRGTFLLPLSLLPIFALHSMLMNSGSMHLPRIARRVSLGSISLVNFWGSTPEMDRETHAIALGVLIIPLLLALQFRKHESKEQSFWPLGLVALLSLGIGFGPYLNFSNNETLYSLPTHWLLSLPGFSSLGFPIRLAQPFLLVSSVLAAVVLTKKVRQHSWLALLLPLSIIEVLNNNIDSRQEFWNVETASLNEDSTSGIFTLRPQDPPYYKGSDADIILYMLDCTAQTTHRRAIPNNCLSTNIQDSTAKTIHRNILQNILEQKPVFPLLKEHQLEELLYYPVLFKPEDRRRVEAALKREGQLIKEGNSPLQFQVYKEQKDPAETSETFTSFLEIEIITTKTYQEPLQIIGDGIFLQTIPAIEKEQIVHQVTIENSKQVQPLLIQTQNGEKIWEGILYPNPNTDQILIRAEAGPQIELPALNSPAIVIKDRKWIYLLWGTLGVFALISLRRQNSVTKQTQCD
jgi:hypothetical protein